VAAMAAAHTAPSLVLRLAPSRRPRRLPRGLPFGSGTVVLTHRAVEMSLRMAAQLLEHRVVGEQCPIAGRRLEAPRCHHVPNTLAEILQHQTKSWDLLREELLQAVQQAWWQGLHGVEHSRGDTCVV